MCACLREHSIPPLHAAAGLLKIAEMDYNGVNSLFLRVLIEKKYALVRKKFFGSILVTAFDDKDVGDRFNRSIFSRFVYWTRWFFIS